MGTSCYLITKFFAQTLLDLIEQEHPNIQVDWWLSRLRVTQPIFLTLNPITDLSTLSIASDIGHTPTRSIENQKKLKQMYKMHLFLIKMKK